MKRLLLCAAIATAILSPLACDLSKLGNQISAERVMVGTLLSTPEVSISPSAFLGVDGGMPDSGTSFSLPGQTAALVVFASRGDGQGQPDLISNAAVRLDTGSGTPVTIEPQGLGTYGLTSSGNDGKLRYQPGATYRLSAALGSERFISSVENAPQAERIDALHPASGYVPHPASQALRLQRPNPSPGTERALGFVTVFPVSDNGEKGQITYTNLPDPTNPLSFLEIVLAPDRWRSAAVDIPGTAFPERNTTYLVIFQAAKLGGPETENLFIGSALLAGAADVGVVRTQ